MGYVVSYAMVELTHKERFGDVVSLLKSLDEIEDCIVNSHTTTAKTPSNTTVTVDLTIFHNQGEN